MTSKVLLVSKMESLGGAGLDSGRREKAEVLESHAGDQHLGSPAGFPEPAPPASSIPTRMPCPAPPTPPPSYTCLTLSSVGTPSTMPIPPRNQPWRVRAGHLFPRHHQPESPHKLCASGQIE